MRNKVIKQTLLQEFRAHVTKRGVSIYSVSRVMRGTMALLDRFTFEEIVKNLNNQEFEKTVKSVFMKEFSEIYTMSLISGVRQFREFLQSLHTLDGLDLSELEKNQLRRRFEEYLFNSGYNRKYICRLRRGSNKLISKYRLSELMEHMCKKEFEEQFIRKMRRNLNTANANINISGFRRFKEFLIKEEDLKATVSIEKVYKTQYEKFTRELQEYLILERNFDPSWAKRHLRVLELLELFMADHSIFNLEDINHDLILDFSTTQLHGASYKSILRNLLRLMYRNGYLTSDLSFIVLHKRTRPNKSRKFISPNEVEKILSSLPEESASEKRNKAMFYLYARLALRVKETARIKLSDIDWVNGTLTINGKAGKKSILPLPQDAGDKILDYLRNSYRGNSKYLFLSTVPPYGQYRATNKLIDKLKWAYSASGVTCPTPETRLNVFRHSLATKELNSGTSMLNVSKLLRHESPETTLVYAKYNLESFRGFAMPWPGAMI